MACSPPVLHEQVRGLRHGLLRNESALAPVCLFDMAVRTIREGHGLVGEDEEDEGDVRREKQKQERHFLGTCQGTKR